MDLMTIAMSFVKSNPQLLSAIETAVGQPIDHIGKCLSACVENISTGPGIRDIEAEKQQKFNYIYNAGLKMGFSDWESEIAAAGYSGYSPVDIALSFEQNRGWSVSAEEIENLAKTIAPRFNDLAVKYNFIQPPKAQQVGIPNSVKRNTSGGTPPWRNKKDTAAADADKSQFGQNPVRPNGDN